MIHLLPMKFKNAWNFNFMLSLYEYLYYIVSWHREYIAFLISALLLKFSPKFFYKHFQQESQNVRHLIHKIAWPVIHPSLVAKTNYISSDTRSLYLYWNCKSTHVVLLLSTGIRYSYLWKLQNIYFQKYILENRTSNLNKKLRKQWKKHLPV